MNTKTIVAIVAGAILLVGATAGASVYMIEKNSDANVEELKTSSAIQTSNKEETITYSEPRQAPRPACDDDNIVGKVVGGAAGGVAGSQFGKGNGKTAATIGGTIGGSLLGEEYIPTKNVTCR